MKFKITVDCDAVFIVRDAATNRPLGTAFAFLRANWLVTAAHVVVHDDGSHRSSIVCTSLGGKTIPAVIHFVHPNFDMAILELTEASPCKTPLFPSYERFVGGNGFVCVGYSPSESNHEGQTYTVNVNRIEKYEREERQRKTSDEQLISFNSPFIVPGHSGGPILGEGGGVVGVVIEDKAQATEAGAGGDRSVDSQQKIGVATGILPLLGFLTFDVSKSRKSPNNHVDHCEFDS